MLKASFTKYWKTSYTQSLSAPNYTMLFWKNHLSLPFLNPFDTWKLTMWPFHMGKDPLDFCPLYFQDATWPEFCSNWKLYRQNVEGPVQPGLHACKMVTLSAASEGDVFKIALYNFVHTDCGRTMSPNILYWAFHISEGIVFKLRTLLVAYLHHFPHFITFCLYL
jgi:hypothetical protein